MRLSSVIIFITFALSASTFPIADYSRTWRNSVQKRGPSGPEHTPMETKKLQEFLGVDDLPPETFEVMLNSEHPMQIKIFAEGFRHQAITTFRSSSDGPQLNTMKLVYDSQSWMIHYQSQTNGLVIDQVDSLDSRGQIEKTGKGLKGIKLLPRIRFDRHSRTPIKGIIKGDEGELTAVTFDLGSCRPELHMMTTLYPDGQTRRTEYRSTIPKGVISIVKTEFKVVKIRHPKP